MFIIRIGTRGEPAEAKELVRNSFYSLRGDAARGGRDNGRDHVSGDSDNTGRTSAGGSSCGALLQDLRQGG